MVKSRNIGIGARISFVLVAGLTIGAGPCPPIQVHPATLEIDNLNTKAKWESGPLAVTPLVFGWRRGELTPINLAGDDRVNPTFEVRLTGGWPLEAFFFDVSASTEPVCEERTTCNQFTGCTVTRSCSPLWEVPISSPSPFTHRYASLPGLPDVFPRDEANNFRFAFPTGTINAARIIKHGACSVRQPLVSRTVDGEHKPGLFETINDALWQQYRSAVWGRGYTPQQDNGAYQASFIRDPEQGAPFLGNEDGFTLFLKLRTDATLGGVDTTANASFAVSMGTDGALTVSLVGVSGFDHSTGAAGSPSGIYGTISGQLRDSFPGQLHTAALAAATRDIEVEVIKGSPLVPVTCNPAACSDPDADPAGYALAVAKARKQCRQSARGGFAALLQEKKGMSNEDAFKVVDALRDENFDCRINPSKVGSSIGTQKGVCTFRPYFKRAVMTPEYLEMVYYEEGDAPSPDYQIASLQSEPFCRTDGMPWDGQWPKEIPAPGFSHEPASNPGCATEEVKGCQGCQALLDKGCNMPEWCKNVPFRVADGDYCGTCPSYGGTLKRGARCNTLVPLCEQGLLCYQSFSDEIKGTPGYATCQVAGSSGKTCYHEDRVIGTTVTDIRYKCTCGIDLVTGNCSLP